MTEEEAPNTTFLKTVVIILGILIIGVASLIIFTIYKRAMTPSTNAEVSATPMPEGKENTVSNSTFADVVVDVPSNLSPLSVDSTGDRLVVTYGIDQLHPEMIVIIQQSTGKILGRIILKK